MAEYFSTFYINPVLAGVMHQIQVVMCHASKWKLYWRPNFFSRNSGYFLFLQKLKRHLQIYDLSLYRQNVVWHEKFCGTPPPYLILIPCCNTPVIIQNTYLYHILISKIKYVYTDYVRCVNFSGCKKCCNKWNKFNFHWKTLEGII